MNLPMWVWNSFQISKKERNDVTNFLVLQWCDSSEIRQSSWGNCIEKTAKSFERSWQRLVPIFIVRLVGYDMILKRVIDRQTVLRWVNNAVRYGLSRQAKLFFC